MAESNDHHLTQIGINFISGGITNAFGKTVIAPIERVKLLRQTQYANEEMKKKEMRYRGFFSCFRGIIKNEGFLALWRGNVINIMKYIPNQAFMLAFRDIFRSFGPSGNEKNQQLFVMKNILVGSAAGASSLFVTYPFEFVRTRVTIDVGRSKDRLFKGSIDCFAQIYRSDGIKVFYKGISLPVCGVIAYRGFYFGAYDTGRKFFSPNTDFIVKFLFAQSVTIASGMFAYPLDTVMRRVMMMGGIKARYGDNVGLNVVYYKGVFDCIRQIYANEGIRGFYRGVFINIFSSIGSAFALVIYDEMKNKNNQKNY